MTTKLSEKEFKKLVIDVAKNISPVLVQKENDVVTNAENIAFYAKQIAISVNDVLVHKDIQN
ncbi:hypothetical protein [Polaribacter sp.]|uniref:hypothetical protein n=1 Tax=Polaribacter sp. TaxID=1920175 RepID=UPI003F6C46BD